MTTPTRIKLETVTVQEGEGSRYEKLSDYIGELNEMLNSIPEQFRDSATIEIGAGDYYGSATPHTQIYYTRPVTP